MVCFEGVCFEGICFEGCFEGCFGMLFVPEGHMVIARQFTGG